MNILLIGADPYSPTDGVITLGIKYILSRTFPDATYDHVVLNDLSPQPPTNFNWTKRYDVIVVCGTPWLWDSFNLSYKYGNLLNCFSTHPNAERLFMGIGSCMFLDDVDSNILERSDEVAAMREMLSGATVICRDHVALFKLTRAEIKLARDDVKHLHYLPCPAYFCHGDDRRTSTGENNVLVFQDPTVSISAQGWQDPAKLKSYYDKMRTFKERTNAIVYCALAKEVHECERQGLGTPILLRSPQHTLEVMSKANLVLSGRVHCAVPAIQSGCETELMALDTRSYVVEDFKETTVGKYHLEAYDSIMRGLKRDLLTDRKVGTESRRTHKEKLSNGFYDKYMSGSGLDVGYAGYTKGAKSILPGAVGVDRDYPGYDGVTLPFNSDSQDYVYSSHTLEHVEDQYATIKEWHRVVKPNGHIVIVVPHQFLYEKKLYLPSKWNEDHKAFYTPASLLRVVEEVLPPNSYRVRLLEDGDKGFNYAKGPDQHSDGQYEITLVIQKITPPSWNLQL